MNVRRVKSSARGKPSEVGPKCPLCHGRYTKPKLLPCIHTFCDQCITDHVNKTAKASYFNCPLCSACTHVSSVKDNVFLRNCLAELQPEDTHFSCDLCRLDGEKKHATSICIQCTDHLCQTCAEGHKKSRMTRMHEVVCLEDGNNEQLSQQIRSRQRAFCDVHPDMAVETFCVDCKVLICQLCKAVAHIKHNVQTISVAADKATMEMKKILEQVSEKLQLIEGLVGEVESVQEYVKKEKKWLQDKLDSYFAEVRNAVNEKERHFKEKLKEESDNLEMQFKTRLTCARNDQMSIHNVFQYTMSLLEKGNGYEKLHQFRDIRFRLYQLNKLDINTQVDVPSFSLKFVTRPEVMYDIITHEMSGQSHLSLSKSSVKLSTNQADHEKQQRHEENEPVEPSTRYPDSPKIFKRAELVSSFDTRLKGERECECFGIYVKRERYYVTDFENKMVKVFHRCGNFQCFLDKGRQKLDVCGYDDDVYLTDNDCKGVATYDKNFRLKKEFRNIFSAGGRIACDKNRIVIADWFKGGKLIITDLDGNEKSIVDKASLGLNQFRPYYVAIDPNGHIVTTDWNAKCVYILNTSGTCVLHTYRPHGHLALTDPWGVCCDQWGNVIVADSNYGRPGCLHMMSSNGTHVSILVTKEDGLDDPTGVAISGPGEVAVVEVRGMVKVYKYMNLESGT